MATGVDLNAVWRGAGFALALQTCTSEKTHLKKVTFLAVASLVFLVGATAYGQQADFALGFSTIHSAPASSTSTLPFPPVSLTGGLYPSISGDILIKKNVGVGGEISWRGGQGNYDFSQPYRPIFWDFDGIFMPKLGPHAAAELSAGIGAESTRFYTNFINCSPLSCTNYSTNTHFMGQFGAGLKLYARGGLFVRPEVHLYLVNNNAEYTSSYVVRYGASIGYTFGAR
jgi:hypothetical protein